MSYPVYLLEEEDYVALKNIAARLQGQSDRERDTGHTLSLILDRAQPYDYDPQEEKA